LPTPGLQDVVVENSVTPETNHNQEEAHEMKFMQAAFLVPVRGPVITTIK